MPRACENHVFIASSTYCSTNLNWMISAICEREGRVLAEATVAASTREALQVHNMTNYLVAIGEGRR